MSGVNLAVLVVVRLIRTLIEKGFTVEQACDLVEIMAKENLPFERM